MATREQKRWQHDEAAKTMRLVRKEIKHNRKPKGENWKNRNPKRRDDPASLDEAGGPQAERSVPGGERERRRAVASAALAKLEKDQAADALRPPEETPGQQGVVVEVSSSLCRVDVDGQDLLCGLRGSLSARDTGFTNVVAVGDRVIVSPDGAGRGFVLDEPDWAAFDFTRQSLERGVNVGRKMIE